MSRDRLCGVYAIRHKTSGRVYVGSSLDVYGRWATHAKELTRNRHFSRHLQHAWTKYGAEAFEFVIMETCLPEERIAREQACIDFYRAADRAYGFNLSTTAAVSTPSAEGCERIAASKRGKARSPETRAKLADAQRGKTLSAEHRAKISISGRGKTRPPRSVQWRAKQSAVKLGRKRGPYSEEHRAHISAALTGRFIGRLRPPRSPEHRASLSAAMTGKRHTPETKAKISAAKTGKSWKPKDRASWLAACRASAKQRGMMLIEPAKETVS